MPLHDARISLRKITEGGPIYIYPEIKAVQGELTELRRIGDWQDQPAELVVSGITSNDKHSCAVFVQRENHREILGAAAC